MSEPRPQPPIAVSGLKPGDGDDAESVVSDGDGDGEASALDSDFCNALQVFETPGYLTSFFTLPELARSGLAIYRVGEITLPLGEMQARQIMGQAKRFKNTTVVQPGKLDSTQFELDPSVWGGRLRALFRHIAPGLGYFDQSWEDEKIPTPSAVLLLEKGATVDCHYLPNGMGHIMIYLPSADHQGGEVATKFGGREKTVFSPNKTEEHFTSWFPNSKLQPVKSGYALVIVFSFVPVKGSISGSALLWRDETRAIRHTLKRWLTKDAGSREKIALYCPLEGDYRTRKLRFKQLRSQDEGRVQVLKRISDNFGLKLYFGHIEHDQKKKFENSDDYEDTKGGPRIAKLVNLDGRLVTENLHLDKAHVPEGFFNGMKWESDKRGAPSLIRKGHMAFLVLVPCDAIVPFFVQRGSGDNHLSAKEQIPRVLGEYARICISSQRSKNALSVFKELCELMWDPPRNPSEGDTQSLYSKKPEFQNSDLIDVLKATIQLKWYSWFEKIAAAHEGSLSTSFFGWVPEYFHKSTVKIDKWLKPLEKGLSAAVLSYPRVKQQVRAVETFFPIIMADSGRLVARPPECLIRWARQVLQKSIESCGSKKLDRRDGAALVKLSLYFDDSLAVISQVVNEIDPGSQPDALLGFISEIDRFGRYDYISYEKSQELYRKASRALITSAAFAQMHGLEKEESSGADFLSRLGDFVFGGSGPKNPIEPYDGGSDDEHIMLSSDDEDYTSGYMPAGIDPGMDLDEPDFDPFGYHSHNHHDYQAYKAYQEFELNGGKPETEVVESQVQPATLGLWMQQVMEISTKHDDIFSLALSKMGEVAPQISSADFRTLWIPALKGIAPKMARLGLERSKDPNTLLWRKNMYTLFKAYLDSCVGPWPRQSNLALVHQGIGCGCADCKGLDVFLADASLKVGHFTASVQQTKHIGTRIITGDADVSVEGKNIEGISKKRRLTVTKSRLKMLSRARTAWRERRDEASKQLGSFEQKPLAAMLGPEWMTLFSMAHLGGPSLSDLDMRTALRMKTERENIPREPAYMDPSTIAMFFGGGFPTTDVETHYL